MPPRKTEGAPPPAERLPETTSAAAKQQEGTVVLSVRRSGGARQYPRANASQYEPVPGRGRIWLSIRCPRCGGVHLARLRPGAEPGGRRRTPCGTVWVIVRSRYGAKRTA